MNPMADLDLLGGKGANLVRLREAGFEVPLFVVLGTDGFGRSDTRAKLRRFFGVDRHHIVAATLSVVMPEKHPEALRRYEIPGDSEPPWAC